MLVKSLEVDRLARSLLGQIRPMTRPLTVDQADVTQLGRIQSAVLVLGLLDQSLDG